MKRLFLALLVFIAFSNLNAQDIKEAKVPPNGWDQAGSFQLLFNQSAFNKEWTGGGTSSVSGNLTLNYDFNYRADDFTWDNRILANYGLTKLKNDEFARKTSDRVEFNSIAGKQIQETKWYYSYFLNFRSQIAKGYEFSEDADTGETIRTETTHFLSPGYLQTGPGLLWKYNEHLSVNIAPATARLIFVDDEFTTVPGYVDGDYFGVDGGKSTRFEFGASVGILAKMFLLENVTAEHSLNLYSNYLDKPGNIDIDYLLNVEMSINKYLSANIIFQTIYDDNTVGAFQIREVFGLGINNKF